MKSKITLADVNKIVSKILTVFLTAFQVSLGQLDDKEKVILSMLTSGKSLENVRKQEIRELENKQISDRFFTSVKMMEKSGINLIRIVSIPSK